MVPGRGHQVSVWQNVGPLVCRLRTVKLVRLQTGHVVIVAEVTGGGGHSEVVPGREMDPVHREARLPGPLVGHVVADGQLVALVPRDKFEAAAEGRSTDLMATSVS